MGNRNSDAYNEKIIMRIIPSTTALIENPPSVFKKNIFGHFSKCGLAIYERFKTSLTKVTVIKKSGKFQEGCCRNNRCKLNSKV